MLAGIGKIIERLVSHAVTSAGKGRCFDAKIAYRTAAKAAAECKKGKPCKKLKASVEKARPIVSRKCGL